MTGPGVVVLSLDTELAWGSFDKNGVERYGPAYRRTPEVVERLCDLFEQYDVPATWAFVAHLLDDCTGHATDEAARATGHGTDEAARDRAAWLADAPCSTGVDRQLWYAPELLERVRACATPQDVGLHGYSHLPFGDATRAAARAELTAAVETFQNAGIDPDSFVFPRNDVAHTDLLAAHGLSVYRGVDARWYERRELGVGRKPLRFLDEVATRTPPAVRPGATDGVVCVPGSQVFRPSSGPWRATPSGSQVTRARKGLERAAETGRIFHLWFHPFNLATDPDHHLGLLEDILTYVATLRDDDELEPMSLSAVAEAARDGRWDGHDRRTETE